MRIDDDRLVSMLAGLRHERLDRAADASIRRRLEEAWATRQERRRFSWRLRQLAPILTALVLVLGLGGATIQAPGDSPLYAVRVAVEDLAVPLHLDAASRAEYALWLLDQRMAEAARLEATGNVLGAGRARAAEQDALRIALANLPVAPETEEQPASKTPEPTATPTPEPTPSPSPSPTPSPTPSASPSPTLSPRTPAPSPLRTPLPTTAAIPAPASTPPTTPRPSATPVLTPKPTSSASPIIVTATGTVKNPDGSLAGDVCVALSTSSNCLTHTAQGTFKVAISAKVGQSVTFYFMRFDATGKLIAKGFATATVKTATLDLGIIRLIQ